MNRPWANRDINTKYVRRVIIYLESKEDYQIFKERWFYDQGEFLEFRSADNGSGGGCGQVMNQVESDRKKGIIAFGIVDRDALMGCNKWNSFWETDDDEYINAKPLGDYVRPLCRWEIENYLLDPEEIENILADLGRDAPRESRPSQIVTKELLQHCDALIPVMAANIVLHQNNKQQLKVSFSSDIKTRTDMEKRTSDALSRQLGGEQNVYQDYMSKIEAFAENHPEGSEARWDRLNRMIDGKRIYRRITSQDNLSKNCRFQLARRIKEKDIIDQEVIGLVEYFKGYCP